MVDKNFSFDDRHYNSAPLVSVVTPFYNTAEWLPECIESVLNQSLGNFEYILLDNLSTDGGDEIAQKYAKSDSRIRYVRNKHFLEQMQNFNAALTLISPETEYTKIVNADDVIYPTCLEAMVGVAQQYPTVGVVSNEAVRGRKLAEVSRAVDEWPFESEMIDGRVAAKHQLLHRIRFVTSPTTMLYRSRIVRKRLPFFNQSRLHADMDTYFDILRVWDLAFISESLTFLRSRDEGVSAGISTIDPLCHLLDEFMLTKKYGREFLVGDELERCWGVIRQEYLDHLARNFVKNRNREFWQHHEKGLKAIDYRISRWTLMRQAGSLGLRILCNPVRLRRLLQDCNRTVIHKTTISGEQMNGLARSEEPSKQG